MGAWDTDPFGNDTACDWIHSLLKADDISVILDALDAVIRTGSEYLESQEAEEAIAAADTLARLSGNFYVRNSYTEELDAWVENQKYRPTPEDINLATQALRRIETEPSELLSLWEDNASWFEHLEFLKKRLHSSTQ